MKVGAGSTLAKEVLEMVVVGAEVDGGVHDVHETASRGTAGTGTAGHRAGDGKRETQTRPVARDDQGGLEREVGQRERS